MNHQILQIGSEIIQSEEIISLLKEHLMLPQFVREIIVDQAIADIECTEEEENLAKTQFLQQNKINSEETLHSWLQQNNLEIEQLNNIATRGIKLEKFKTEKWTYQIESYFMTRKAQLDRMIYSLIRVSDGGMAQELYFRILEGEEDLPQIARQYSEGSESNTGGLIGPVEMSVPHPAISQRLKSATVGQLYPPMRVQQWWVILRLEKFIPAQLDEKMKNKLLNELFINWLNEEAQEKVSLKIVEESLNQGDNQEEMNIKPDNQEDKIDGDPW